MLSLEGHGMDSELLIVGAGPQALTLVTYLQRLAPAVAERVVVVDTQPWLSQWDAQFASLRIPLLRSGCVHHPDPDPYALIDFARHSRREAEMTGRIGRPSTDLFRDFCTDLIGGLQSQRLHMQARVTRLVPAADSMRAHLSTGEVVSASRVILATNPVAPVVPEWMHGARRKHCGEPGLYHSGQVSVHDFEPGSRVLVVGGGLTAVQLVEGAVAAGAEVMWVTRAGLRVRALDIEATWLGPDLAAFQRVSNPAWRVGQAMRARGGGSIPAEEHRRIEALVRRGRVLAMHHCAVSGLRRRKGRWDVCVQHRGRRSTVAVDQVVAATGSRAHIRRDPLLRPLIRDLGIRHAQGFPVLSHDLRPSPAPLHIMGPLALTQVGPATRTIIGARIASERLLTGIAGDDVTPRQYPRPDGS